jgi:fused signal recognition particle receptor
VFSFLKKSRNSEQAEAVELPTRTITSAIRSLFPKKIELEELEDVLIRADFGIDASEEITKELRQQASKLGITDDSQLRVLLRDLLSTKLTRADSELNLKSETFPYVFLVVGVNGVGKTTTIGKLAKWLTDGKWKVVIGAADTFRAAAVEQLATWADRAGAELVRPQTAGQDPASVAYQTVERAIVDQADIAIIDTAGRLQNKQDLMDELSKITRSIQKQASVSEVLLVLDATMGQNALSQAKSFAEAASVTGVVLTKLDGSAKGGIAYAIQQQLGIPIKLVGVGEGENDFAFFSPKDFATGLVAN